MGFPHQENNLRKKIHMAKTIKEINEEISQGKAAAEVDVVTTGTLGPICSSGAFLNIGHTQPRIKPGDDLPQ